MSNIIPPMVSSTPPPMDDDNLDEDDDESFGDFSTADHGYDLSQPSKLAFNAAWDENTKDFSDAPECDRFTDVAQCNGTHLILDFQTSSMDNTVGEFDASNSNCVAASSRLQQEADTSQGSVVSTGTDSGLCSVSPNSVATSPVPQTDDLERISPFRDDSSSSDETVIKSSQADMERTLLSSISNGSFMQQAVAEVTSDETSKNILAQTENILSDLNSTQHLGLGRVDTVELSETITGFRPDSSNTGFTESDNDLVVSNFQSPTPPRSPSSVEDVPPRDECVPTNKPTSDSPNCFNVITSLESASHRGETQCRIGSENCDFTTTIVSNDSSSRTNSATFQDDEFEEFATFDGSVISVDKLEFPIEQTKVREPENQNITRDQLDFSIEDEDEFSDFASSSVTGADTATTSLFPTSEPTSSSSNWASASAAQLPTLSTIDDDDFGNFDTAIPPEVEITQASAAHVASVVATMFPWSATATESATEAPALDRGLIVDGSAVWSQLRDVDTSNALSYQWVNSSANKMLLAALGIDSRNILFGPKWNISVPRFAANLSVSPLQPIQASSPVPVVPTVNPPPRQEPTVAQEPVVPMRPEVAVPDPQFDWTSSGLVNPLDCLEKEGQRATPQENPAINHGQWLLANTSQQKISAEAARIIGGLPDISFIRSKMLVLPHHRPARSQS